MTVDDGTAEGTTDGLTVDDGNAEGTTDGAAETDNDRDGDPLENEDKTDDRRKRRAVSPPSKSP